MPRAGAGLHDPVVRRVAVLYAVARIPAAAVWLSVLLDVSARSDSYGRAGTAVALYGCGVALVAPVVGRLADRHGGRPVLLVCAAVQLPALLVLRLLAGNTGLEVLAAAFVAGAAQPPLVPCMRAAWSHLVPDASARTACLSFDAVLGEAVDLAAPLVAVALQALPGTGGSLPVVAVTSTGAVTAFALAAPLRERPDVVPLRRPSAPTRQGAWTLGLIAVLTAALGAVEIGVVAAADAAGHRAAAGAVLALFAGTSILGGVVHARRSSSAGPTQQLASLLAPMSACLLGAALAARDLPLAALLIAVAGVVVAPLVAVLLGMVERTAREGGETAAFTWATTANFIGVSLGSVVAGAVVDRDAGAAADPGSGALLVAAAAAYLALVGVAVVARLAPELRRPAPRPAPRASDDAERERLVVELEELWRRTRRVTARNEQIVRAACGRGPAADRVGASAPGR